MRMMKTKIVAFHLPQFHEIPENNRWWGEGFTEWTNTKKAVPLFKGHHQPRTPLNNKYYDLSKAEALSWQMELASKYKLDGFCYYHYWFNGKLLLEKPLEIMRTLTNRIDYCFCWANEPWIRSWEGSNEVLMEQSYPGKEDWEKHFEYFKDFFEDEKYIKIDNKPVLVIYRTRNIDDCDAMISYWDECCKKIGMDGIYIIEEKNGFQNKAVCSNSKAYLEFEPLYTNKFCRNDFEKTIDYLHRKIFSTRNQTSNLIYNYNYIWKNILRRKHEIVPGKSTCLGAFVDWDNTARKGKNSTFFVGANPKKFEKYLKAQMKIATNLDSPFIFLNAWNEWGEGTYLEPDDKNGYGYLEALERVKKG